MRYYQQLQYFWMSQNEVGIEKIDRTNMLTIWSVVNVASGDDRSSVYRFS